MKLCQIFCYKNFLIEKYLFMFIFFNIIFILIGVALVTIYKISTVQEKTNYVFYLKDKTDIVNSLSSLMRFKVKNNKIKGNWINKKDFLSLGLVEAPVYVIKGNALNDSHLKLYQKAIEKIDFKLNIIILDKNLKIKNKNINLIAKKSKKLTYKEISLINSLNINFSSPNKTFVGNSDFPNFVRTDKNLEFNLNEGIFEFALECGKCLPIKLPDTPFNYSFTKRKNELKVFNVFKDEIMQMTGDISGELNGQIIQIKSNKNTILKIDLKLDKNKINNLNLLKIKINYKKYQKYIDKLKENAILSLKNDIFLIKNELFNLKINNLNSFFNCVNLRKNYFNDYLFLIKNIFGIAINDCVLTARPSSFVDEDFSIDYEWQGETKRVEFKKSPDDMVKLSYVGHRMGLDKKFVFGF